MEKSLRSSEWVVLVSFFLIFASFCLFTQIKIYKITSSLSPLQSTLPSQLISVTIGGAVSKPGVYEVLPGTSLGAVLKKSKPKRNADLKSIDLNQRIEGPGEWVIQEKTAILVRVMQDGKLFKELEFPLGTRCSSLKSKIYDDLELPIEFLKKRRLLKDGEEIHSRNSILEKKD
jgi:hypothetical protein